MKDYKVLHRASKELEQTIFNCKNVLQARDKFARKKGYANWGKMVTSFRDNRSNNLDKPPYIFELK